MISQSLEYIKNALNVHLKEKTGTSEDKVALNNPVNADGTIPVGNKEKVLLSLVNLDRHAAKAPISFGYKGAAETQAAQPKPGTYTLYVLLSTCYSDYAEALRALDDAIAFIAANPAFEKAARADMPEGIDKLELTQEQADGMQVRSIWLAMGAKYQPSVVCKIVATATLAA